MAKRERRTIGWREWVLLPEHGGLWIKAKVDTGARSSSLHAFELETVRRRGNERVRFFLHPFQRSDAHAVAVERDVLEWRTVTSSSGHREKRPVIVTNVQLFGREWPIELTLTNRDALGFRMLLGRQAIRRRFVVDPGKSFLAGQPSVIPPQRRR